MKNAISPTQEEDFSGWYHEVVKAAQLAENGPARGTMTILPWGYGLWERIQKELDGRFKLTGVENAYFPLLIPLNLLEKEASHVEGFAKECAVVTHTRLEEKQGVLEPVSPLEEPLVIRPTSETVIGEAMARWVSSFRDLPLLLNQWCNIVRWEMRTRMFLRTTEILWQEGHTAHATREEAVARARQMLDLYVECMENVLAIPIIPGRKTEGEKFPGADETYSLEMLMPDGKGLQGGTSHFLGQNFSKAANIRFESSEQKLEYAYTTSWGVTTRLVGALVMTHSDNDGLVLPPRIAQYQVVILPVIPKEEMRAKVLQACEYLAGELRQVHVFGEPLRVHIDGRPMRGGEKKWHWVKKGAPLRIEIGPRDLESKSAFVTRRDGGRGESVEMDALISAAPCLLETMQNQLFEKAKKFVDGHITDVTTEEELSSFFKAEKKGLVRTYMCDDPTLEEKLKNTYAVTTRCIPFETEDKKGPCIFTGKEAPLVLIGQAY